MEELKFYNEIHKYNSKERIRLYIEIIHLIDNYDKLVDILDRILNKEPNRDKVANVLSVLLKDTDIRNLKAENCIDVDFLDGTVYTILFNDETRVSTNIEHIDFNGFIWSMNLEEYKELEKELKIFIGEK